MELISREYVVAVAKRNGIDPREQNFRVIKNGLNGWAADPFPIEVDGKLYIFAEIFVYSKVKGCIGYTKFENNHFTPWKVIIEEPYHMSFPYLFYENGILYMCPETSASKRLYLYRCVSFPEKWVKDRILHANGNFSDTVFYWEKDEIYGFSCEWHGIEDHKLRLFRVDEDGCTFSEGNMKTLPFYLTRPAGKIFKEERSGKNLMVSQICKPKYGSGFIFKDFSINWPDYKEHELYKVYPENICVDKKRNYVGTHTFNLSENYMVVDLVWERFSPVEKFFRILRRLHIKCLGN